MGYNPRIGIETGEKKLKLKSVRMFQLSAVWFFFLKTEPTRANRISNGLYMEKEESQG